MLATLAVLNSQSMALPVLFLNASKHSHGGDDGSPLNALDAFQGLSLVSNPPRIQEGLEQPGGSRLQLRQLGHRGRMPGRTTQLCSSSTCWQGRAWLGVTPGGGKPQVRWAGWSGEGGLSAGEGGAQDRHFGLKPLEGAELGGREVAPVGNKNSNTSEAF